MDSSPLPLIPSFNQPFGVLTQLKKSLSQTKVLPPPTPPPICAPKPAEPDDASLFQAAVSGIAPLANKDKKHLKNPLPFTAWEVPQMPDEDLEALRTLTDLVCGQAEFDLTYTPEYVEGQVKGLPPVLMERLRSGRIPIQNYLDLHGLN
ncbi:MAG: hypothetical protein ACRCTY_04430, partial [Candidatus Adiutrix sp.]